MATARKKWPSYALESLEDMRFQFTETHRLTEQAKQLMKEGKVQEAKDLLNDIQLRSVWGVSLTVQAYTGVYEEDGLMGLSKGKALR